jgi:putative membrane protein
LLTRFNWDPRLLTALAALALCHALILRNHGRSRQARGLALGGWAVAATALVSPLCALSVALFSARVAQHMVLLLVAAPLIAGGLPRRRDSTESWTLWISTMVFFAALWFWHMPVPYDATFTSTPLYWAMHLTLFGSSILLWRELIHHSSRQTAQVLAAGMLTLVQMGLLGAVFALGDRPMFLWHLTTTQAWGLTPLQDQQLGGAVMWVPGIALFLWAAIRSINRLWRSVERARPA